MGGPNQESPSEVLERMKRGRRRLEENLRACQREKDECNRVYLFEHCALRKRLIFKTKVFIRMINEKKGPKSPEDEETLRDLNDHLQQLRRRERRRRKRIAKRERARARGVDVDSTDDEAELASYGKARELESSDEPSDSGPESEENNAPKDNRPGGSGGAIPISA